MGDMRAKHGMVLVQDTSRAHISHYFNLVSAYHLNPDNLDRLMELIREAIPKAKESGEGVIVEQDCHEHIFVVHPSGAISLYACMGTFTIEDNI